jgi:hypothetical protein
VIAIEIVSEHDQRAFSREPVPTPCSPRVMHDTKSSARFTKRTSAKQPGLRAACAAIAASACGLSAYLVVQRCVRGLQGAAQEAQPVVHRPTSSVQSASMMAQSQRI